MITTQLLNRRIENLIISNLVQQDVIRQALIDLIYIKKETYTLKNLVTVNVPEINTYSEYPRRLIKSKPSSNVFLDIIVDNVSVIDGSENHITLLFNELSSNTKLFWKIVIYKDDTASVVEKIDENHELSYVLKAFVQSSKQ